MCLKGRRQFKRELTIMYIKEDFYNLSFLPFVTVEIILITN
jgi:hypothetical protein